MDAIFKFRVEGEGLTPAEIDGYMIGIQKAITDTIPPARLEAAKLAKDLWRAEIERGAAKPLTEGTKRKRIMGKLPGRWPAVKPYPGNHPLMRAKKYYDSIIYAPEGNNRHVTGIQEGARGAPAGWRNPPELVSTYAQWQELGFQPRVGHEATMRELIYILILYNVIRSRGRSTKPMNWGLGHVKTGVIIKRGKTVARPTFGVVAERHEKELLDKFESVFSALFEAKLGSLTRFQVK